MVRPWDLKAPNPTIFANQVQDWLRDHTQQGRPQRVPAQRALIAGLIVGLFQVAGPEPEDDVDEILERCEELASGDPHIDDLLQYLAPAPSGIVNGQIEVSLLTRCERLPKYVPGMEAGLATQHRVVAINAGHTMLLSSATSRETSCGTSAVLAVRGTTRIRRVSAGHQAYPAMNTRTTPPANPVVRVRATINQLQLCCQCRARTTASRVGTTETWS